VVARRVASVASGADDVYDVVVVGGRVAGSLTAALLAQSGVRVLVVDRARFPSSTPSTHFFRGNGLVRALAAAGALGQVLALGAPRLTCEYAYADGETTAVPGEPQDPGTAGYCLSVRRDRLDAALLAHAAAQGAVVETSTAVVDVVAAGERVVGVRLAGGRDVGCGLVVGADGMRSTVAAAVGAVDRERHEGRRALYYRYVEQMPGPRGDADGPEFSLLGDELAYVFPSDNGVTCVAVSVNARVYQEMRHDAATRFEDAIRRHRGIWDRYVASRKVSRLLGSGPRPDFVRQAAGPGWALVGDASLHQDPWSGLGMDSAGVCAVALAESVVAVGPDAAGPSWARGYEQLRDDLLLEGYRDTVSGAADLSALG
jgi:flavin-dependent dehydrogenase